MSEHGAAARWVGEVGTGCVFVLPALEIFVRMYRRPVFRETRTSPLSIERSCSEAGGAAVVDVLEFKSYA